VQLSDVSNSYNARLALQLQRAIEQHGEVKSMIKAWAVIVCLQCKLCTLPSQGL